ncbi:MAG: hypothetical protein LKM31_16965, partial [Sphingobium sp.]|nr:hypothetical protein [Sphingobium sp.]
MSGSLDARAFGRGLVVGVVSALGRFAPRQMAQFVNKMMIEGKGDGEENGHSRAERGPTDRAQAHGRRIRSDLRSRWQAARGVPAHHDR